MLLWFYNPNNNPNSDGKFEQSICSQFYISLKEAEISAKILSGNKVLFMCTAQNPPNDNNVYWSLVKMYGESFELNKLTILPEDFQKEFVKIGNHGYPDFGIG